MSSKRRRNYSRSRSRSPSRNYDNYRREKYYGRNRSERNQRHHRDRSRENNHKTVMIDNEMRKNLNEISRLRSNLSHRDMNGGGRRSFFRRFTESELQLRSKQRKSLPFKISVWMASPERKPESNQPSINQPCNSKNPNQAKMCADFDISDEELKNNARNAMYTESEDDSGTEVELFEHQRKRDSKLRKKEIKRHEITIDKRVYHPTIETNKEMNKNDIQRNENKKFENESENSDYKKYQKRKKMKRNHKSMKERENNHKSRRKRSKKYSSDESSDISSSNSYDPEYDHRSRKSKKYRKSRKKRKHRKRSKYHSRQRKRHHKSRKRYESCSSSNDSKSISSHNSPKQKSKSLSPKNSSSEKMINDQTKKCTAEKLIFEQESNDTTTIDNKLQTMEKIETIDEKMDQNIIPENAMVVESEDDSGSGEEIGPKIAEEFNASIDRRDYGGALLPGEADAIANYVQRGLRIPRRGEVGLTSQEIAAFESIGYVMSGSRHKRMNAIRIRKENQIYSAEEKRALQMVNFEEKLNREKKLMAQYQKLLNSKMRM